MSKVSVRRLLPSEEYLIEQLRVAPAQAEFFPGEAARGVPLQRWGIWQQEELIGFIEVAGTPPVLWISRIGVRWDKQELGYGRAALEALIAQLSRSYRVQEVRAAVHPENLPAQRLFLRVGFQRLEGSQAIGELLFSLRLH
ncbi:MAG: GNAT family N-acetyltransferase [Bacteroidia bacterium]|jgi:RimJ/RimL family protein N-acetyltransferase|nr:GNAT family N-acetyltransferase [Bacteroidia bacterium]GIV23069.1 MAG: hypothetical protein KatS3mg025_0728 [Bacteroidia bacterium]